MSALLKFQAETQQVAASVKSLLALVIKIKRIC